MIALFSDGLDQGILVALLFLLAQQLEGNVLVSRIVGSSVSVHPLWVLFATLAATVLYGLARAVFAVPIVTIIAAVLRYLNGMLLFERWQKAPVMEVVAEGEPKVMVSGGESTGLRGSAGGEG